MTPNQFRRMALSLPESIESAHMNHPDFRVYDKIFATLGPDEAWGMVKLTPDQQQSFMRAEPGVFDPCRGAWGRRGATSVRLELAKEDTVRRALLTAWRNTAPKRLHRELK
jgi:hypothetical protein